MQSFEEAPQENGFLEDKLRQYIDHVSMLLINFYDS